MENTLKVIARIHTDFPEKFGIPRQSGLIPELEGRIVFEPRYRDPKALLGIQEYSHLWLLWDFSLAHIEDFRPTVYPPRLGGKVKKGVFATRSPFRPNSIGLSCVRLERVEQGAEGMVLVVSGADMLDGTPIYDIKPYLPYADSHPDAAGGFGQEHMNDAIAVDFPPELLELLPENKRSAALKVLGQDPRAAYNKGEGYVYGMEFAGFDIRFRVKDGLLTVCGVVEGSREQWDKIK